MKNTQTCAFIKTKKEITLSRESLLAFIETRDKEIQDQLNTLPAFNIADESINKYIQFLTAVLKKSEQKIKQKVIYLLSYLLNLRKNDASVLTQFVKQFNQIEQASFLKVKMAIILFKSVQNKEFKKAILLESIKLLSKQPKLTNLTSLLQTIDPILKELDFSQSELAQIYQLSIKSLQKDPLYKNLTVHIILKLLKLPSNKIDPAITERSLLYLIQNATLNQKIVELVQSSDNNTLAFELFKLFLSGDLEGYKKLSSERSAQIKKLDFNIEDFQKRIKINSIATLAAKNKILKYAEIVQKLNIPKQEVEYYIINAIQSNIISARINEIDEVVVVQDIKSKYFSQEQWKNILGGVQNLKKKLSKYVEAHSEKKN